MQEELLQQVELSLLPGIGPVTIRQLISYCGSASGVFGSSEARLSNIPGIGKKTARSISSHRDPAQAGKQLKLADQIQASIHFYTGSSFPRRLKQLEDGP
jgi:DNA processing protein